MLIVALVIRSICYGINVFDLLLLIRQVIYLNHLNFLWFAYPDTFVPRWYFRINEFSGLLNRPLVRTWKSVPTLFVRTSEISGLSEPGITNHHCITFRSGGFSCSKLLHNQSLSLSHCYKFQPSQNIFDCDNKQPIHPFTHAMNFNKWHRHNLGRRNKCVCVTKTK